MVYFYRILAYYFKIKLNKVVDVPEIWNQHGRWKASIGTYGYWWRYRTGFLTLDVQSQPYGFFYTIFHRKFWLNNFKLTMFAYITAYMKYMIIQIVLAISADGPNRTIPNAPTKRGRLLSYDVQLNHTILYLKSRNFVINILNVL